ncbi:MAG TPA: glycosyltransferase family 9 protein [Candidatus Polarisedimenticolaceae bacterium]
MEFPAEIHRGLADHGAGLRVLVLRLGAFGDILRALPAMRLARFALPDAAFHWVCDDRWAGIVEGHPDLDGVIPLPRRSPSVGAWVAFVRALRAVRPSLVLDFHGNLRSGLVGRLSGAPVRLGHEGHQQKEGNRWLTTHRVPAGERRRSRIDRNLDLVRALGVPASPLPSAGIEIPASAERRAREIVRELGALPNGYAILNPGASASQAYKKPPRPLLQAAATRLSTAGVRPIVVHGPGEIDDARAVAAGAGAGLAPATSIFELAALLAGARLFVGGDSGPLHLACAVLCPVVGIYGPTDPVVNAPWGSEHRVVAPPGRVYTGIRRLDRESGGFAGIVAADVEVAVDALLQATARALSE